MKRALVIAPIVLCFGASLPAGVIVSTTLNLTSFTITPDTGTVVILSQANGGNGVASNAYASVSDTLGDQDFEFNSNVDGPTSAAASIPFASATLAADSSLLTTASTTGVNLPGINAGAGTDTGCCYGQIEGQFEIDSNTATSANVNFAAALSASQTLFTDDLGVSAYSEVIFQLLLPDVQDAPFLFYDSPLSITGPDQSIAQAGTPNQSGTVSLLTNTPYNFLLETDSESYGVDSSAPEPATLALFFSGFTAILIARRHRRA